MKTPPEDLTPQFLRVTNYERYQHYKDRRPVWIKLYLDLLDDYQLKKQKPPTRLLAMLLLIVAAKQDNRIPHDPDWLSNEVGMSVGSVAAGIETLVTIGFLSVASRNHSASKRLARRYQDASPEKRQRKRRDREDQRPLADDQIGEIIDLSLREIA